MQRVPFSYSAVILLVIGLSGCSNQKLEDSEISIKPRDSATGITVEQEGGLVCVTENENPETRTCVPRINE